ncbi:aspartate decarboxylase-domain-containing protein [Pelagophyceae sp. CCMP2097]|nr:aspartate decarboxylase-domain-containing protein [Pelagophyceae sp. CCMP2097]
MDSVAIDADWLDAAGLFEGQEVQLLDEDNGARLYTTVLRGAKASGSVKVSGAAAKLVVAGHALTIVAFGYMTRTQYATFTPGILAFEDPPAESMVRENSIIVYKPGRLPSYRRLPLPDAHAAPPKQAGRDL